MIYLDYAATTPMSDRAIQTYQEVARQYYGNASSLHDLGGTAKQILDAARRVLARCIHGDQAGMYFTGGGSEANYLAIRSLVKGALARGRHVITSQVEHASVTNTFRALEEEGFTVTYVPVDTHGVVDLDELERAITPETILVSITHASPEVGTLQPIEAIGVLLDGRDILFHSDCVQSFGKVPIDVRQAKLDSLTLSAHKLYGPKGVGACYIAPSVYWRSAIPGTTHEGGFRPGTVDVPGIASFAVAVEESMECIERESKRCKQLCLQLLSGVQEAGWPIVLEGHPTTRIPHHLSLRIPGMEGQYAMLECNRHNVAVSTGTACQVGQQSPSPALLAMGRSHQEAVELIRISVGRHTTEAEIATTINVLDDVLQAYFHRSGIT